MPGGRRCEAVALAAGAVQLLQRVKRGDLDHAQGGLAGVLRAEPGLDRTQKVKM